MTKIENLNYRNKGAAFTYSVDFGDTPRSDIALVFKTDSTSDRIMFDPVTFLPKSRTYTRTVTPAGEGREEEFYTIQVAMTEEPASAPERIRKVGPFIRHTIEQNTSHPEAVGGKISYPKNTYGKQHAHGWYESLEAAIKLLPPSAENTELASRFAKTAKHIGYSETVVSSGMGIGGS